MHFLHYAVVAVSFALTLLAWHYARSQAEARVAAIFEHAADQIVGLTTERMQNYEQGLWAGVGLANALGGQIGLDDWRSFTHALEIDVKYPGVNGIGVVLAVPAAENDAFAAMQRADRPYFDIHPPADRDIYLPITYIEPEDTNLKAVGLDLNFESNRLEGVERARDTGLARITGPIVLVQDSESTPGFLFFAPFYRDAQSTSLEVRREGFLGVIYAPFVMKKLMKGVLARNKRQLRISISDGGETIYDEHTDIDPTIDPTPMFTRKVDVRMYGRSWSMDIRTNLEFRAANSRAQPKVILFGGLTIDTLLLALFLLLSRSNRRIYSYADQVTGALQAEKRELIKTSSALEQFSYAASHDLKTPIRSMRDVTDYLVSDLQDTCPQAFGNARIEERLSTLRFLIDRMDRLVKGILEFSQITRKPIQSVRFHTGGAISRLADDLGLPPDHLALNGDFPEVVFSPGLFTQIVGRILINAIQHHDGASPLQVTVTSAVRGDDLELRISDNGPGIDPRYHEKIFEMFQVLNPVNAPDATGIGLAVVRRAVELVGGSITVDSALGEGASFVVSLPGVTCDTEHLIAAE